MIVHLVGGRDDGTSIDLDDVSDGWALDERLALPLPELIFVHCSPANRTIYRLTRATPEECVYQIDPAETAAYQAKRGQIR